MPLTADDKRDLYLDAKNYWVQARSFQLAYQRAYQKAKRNSNILKILTIVSAVLTAATTAFDQQIVTIIAGIITAGVAAIDQQYHPASESEKYWEARIKLDEIKDELRVIARMVDQATEITGQGDIFKDVIKNLRDAQIPVIETREEKAQAEDDFRGTTIQRYLDELQPSIPAVRPPVGDDEAGLPEDAADIVPLSRTVIGNGG